VYNKLIEACWHGKLPVWPKEEIFPNLEASKQDNLLGYFDVALIDSTFARKGHSIENKQLNNDNVVELHCT
jgi:hypothetical protein